MFSPESFKLAYLKRNPRAESGTQKKKTTFYSSFNKTLRDRTHNARKL